MAEESLGRKRREEKHHRMYDQVDTRRRKALHALRIAAEDYVIMAGLPWDQVDVLVRKWLNNGEKAFEAPDADNRLEHLYCVNPDSEEGQELADPGLVAESQEERICELV
jgi:DNA-binding transcriptional MerR regulator